MTLSASVRRYIQSLHIKKNQKIHSSFIVEGEKCVKDLLLSNYEVSSIYMSKDFEGLNIKNIDVVSISSNEMEKISNLNTSSGILAVAKTSSNNPFIPQNNPIIMLDKIQDPGNMGTIIRTANWFGINTIVCSKDTVDCYNSKVVQASMGALFHTQLIYTSLTDFLKQYTFNQVIGACLKGSTSIYNITFQKNTCFIFGNESKGISQKVMPHLSNKVFIPNYNEHIESLNVAIAVGIFCYNYKLP